MATVARTYLVDDLDGSQEDVHTVRFALDGTNYEIDLSGSNAGRLREKLGRFVDAASRAQSAQSAPLGAGGWKAPTVSRSKRSVRGPSRLDMRCPHVGGSRRRSGTRSTRPTEMAGVELIRLESPANRGFKHPDPAATSVKVKIVLIVFTYIPI